MATPVLVVQLFLQPNLIAPNRGEPDMIPKKMTHTDPPTMRQNGQDELIVEQAALARYIADLTAELARMAGQKQLDLLTYLLNMARVEAELTARRDPSFEIADIPDEDWPEAESA
jgi:signal transduction histidine kinase